MIKFTLKCGRGHAFESWFQSAGAFEKLREAGMVSCAVCGGGGVEKALMAPRVHAARDASDREHRARNDTGPSAPVAGPSSERPLAPSGGDHRIAELRRRIEATADYVGTDFARAARDIHDGTVPERAIYGEARPDEARRLLEDGVPVAPLPFVPGRRSN